MADLYAQYDPLARVWVLTVRQDDVATDEIVATLTDDGWVEYTDGTPQTVAIGEPAQIIDLY